jgi:CheY-like chemotaxis protein
MDILLLEDHGDTREVTSRILRHLGHTVSSFADGEAIAAHCVKGEAFDLLISDIGLPGENGLKILAKLRSTCKPFKAIAVTAFARDAEIAQCRDAGMGV